MPTGRELVERVNVSRIPMREAVVGLCGAGGDQAMVWTVEAPWGVRHRT